MYSAPDTGTLRKMQETTPGLLNRRNRNMWPRFEEAHRRIGKLDITTVKGLTLDELLEQLKAFSRLISTLGRYCWVTETLGTKNDHKSSEWVGWNTCRMSGNLPDAAVALNATYWRYFDPEERMGSLKGLDHAIRTRGIRTFVHVDDVSYSGTQKLDIITRFDYYVRSLHSESPFEGSVVLKMYIAFVTPRAYASLTERVVANRKIRVEIIVGEILDVDSETVFTEWKIPNGRSFNSAYGGAMTYAWKNRFGHMSHEPYKKPDPESLSPSVHAHFNSLQRLYDEYGINEAAPMSGVEFHGKTYTASSNKNSNNLTGHSANHTNTVRPGEFSTPANVLRRISGVRFTTPA